MIESGEPAPIYYFKLFERQAINDILNEVPDEEIGRDPFGNDSSNSSNSEESTDS